MGFVLHYSNAFFKLKKKMMLKVYSLDHVGQHQLATRQKCKFAGLTSKQKLWKVPDNLHVASTSS